MTTGRSTSLSILLICLCLLLSLESSALAQQPRPIKQKQPGAAVTSKPDVKMLPPALRARGQALLNEQDEQKRADLAEDLAEQEPVAALEFLVALLESDPAPVVRDAIIDQLGDAPAPRMQQALAQLAAADPDVKVALAALDKLRAHRMRETRTLLAQRTEMAKRKGDAAELPALWREQERWIALVKGTMLPAFLRESPPVFSLKEAGQPVRVVTLGDFGYGSPGNRRLAGDGQKQVAAAMLQSHRQSPFDFGVTLGDNFYPDGMESLSDDRWQTLWRELYEPYLKPEGGVHFFVNGGGGARIRKIEPGPRSLFAGSAYAFATLEADAKALAVKFIGTDLKTICEYKLTKGDAP